MPRRKLLLDQGKRASKSQPGVEAPPRHRFSTNFWLIDVVSLLPLWILFVEKVTWSELAVGIAASLFAAAVAEVVRNTGFARFYPHLRWLRDIWRIPGNVLGDTAVLASVLFRRILKNRQERGFLKRIPFPAGGTSGRSAARRALAITLGTLAPNSCVIDIEPYDNFTLLHQIRDAKAPPSIRALRKP